jgi:DNA polymerase-1
VGNSTAALKRVAINTPIQSTAADITKIAMIRLDEALQRENIDAALILQIHDSLICECSAKDEEVVSGILKESMESAVELSVPLEVNLKSGRTLAEV